MKVQEKTLHEEILKGQNKVLDLIARDVPIEDVFTEITQLVEELNPRIICGITMLDRNRVINISPNLPTEMRNAINSMPATELVQKYLWEEVFVSNVSNDPAWQGLRKWLLPYEFSAAWTKPIHTSQGEPVGIFAVVYKEPIESDRTGIELYDAYARIAGLAIERTKSKKNIAESDHRYKSLFDNNLDAVYEFDVNGRFVNVNNAVEGIFGYKPDELVGTSFIQFIVPEDVARALSAFEAVMRCNTVHMELSGFHKSGERRIVQVTCLPIEVDREITGVFCIAKDITSGKYAQELLANQKRVLEMIAKGSTLEGVLHQITRVAEYHSPSSMCNVFLLQHDKRTLRFVAGNERLRAYSEDIGTITIGPDVGACGAAAFFQKTIIVEDIATNPLYKDYRQIALKHGLRACLSTPVVSSRGDVLGTFGLYYDKARSPSAEEIELLKTLSHIAGLAVERKQSDEEIKYLAHHDPLTGLPNRTLFYDRLTEALREEKENDYRLAVMFLDLDRFKSVNDSMGHNFGDRLLCLVADRLKNCVSFHHVLSRMGGDEFTILIPEVHEDECLKRLAQDVLNGLNGPIEMDGHEFRLTVSIGIAVFPTDGDTPDTLMQCADTAMYAAKNHGKNTFRFYEHSMSDKFYERLMIENALRSGMENREFTLHYQPRVKTTTKLVTSIEALLRWNRPGIGLVYPGEFISVAEETGSIVAIGEWIFYEVCRQLKTWEASDIDPVRIAVNVSPRQFQEPDFLDMVKAIINETGVNPQWLEIEVTESGLMNNETEVLDALYELKALGVTISIDDFGVGYSSLHRLRRMPVDALKIDRSFVQDMFQDNAAITKTIVALAHNLNLNVIAEGVETEEQFNLLRALGCDEIQGYLISRPIQIDEFEQRYIKGNKTNNK